MLTLKGQYRGKTIELQISDLSDVADLKELIFEHTQILPQNQKLLGLIKGQLPPESSRLQSLVKNQQSFMIMGTPEADIPKDLDNSDIINDLEVEPVVNDHVQVSLDKLLAKAQIPILHPPRPDKKLIVFDLDHTLYDCRSTVERITDLVRPGAHELLSEIYPFYDICIWSQTSQNWLKAKIREAGFLNHAQYKIHFMLDISCMITITSKDKRGKEFRHQVKPLELIWTRFEHYSAANTIHIDDLSRNFQLNKQSGLKIKPFKEALLNQDDDELLMLKEYLLKIKDMD
ncbi:HAD-like domain-containing protein, partial [Gorgonomyces haynaldii]